MPEDTSRKRLPPALLAAVVVALALLGWLTYRSTRLASDIDAAVSVLVPPPLTAAELKAKDDAERKQAEAAIAALKSIKSYQAAQWHPLHFKPAIDTATNEQCLACHQEVLTHKVRETSPAGVASKTAVAWYQTLDTYNGEQDTFHARHLTTPFAKEVMSLKCTFCHQGSDPREEAPGASATAAPASFTLRKVVDPSQTCLLCHGSFPYQFMEGLDQPWHKIRENFESPDQPNGCLVCHAEQFRTVRHQVSYLNADAIEKAAKTSSDVCLGCHGGRAWYRNTYPYPRHPWPGMDEKNVPEWAKTRPAQSKPEHRLVTR